MSQKTPFDRWIIDIIRLQSESVSFSSSHQSKGSSWELLSDSERSKTHDSYIGVEDSHSGFQVKCEVNHNASYFLYNSSELALKKKVQIKKIHWKFFVDFRKKQ